MVMVGNKAMHKLVMRTSKSKHAGARSEWRGGIHGHLMRTEGKDKARGRKKGGAECEEDKGQSDQDRTEAEQR